MKPIYVRLDKEDLQVLERLSEELGVDKSTLLRLAFRKPEILLASSYGVRHINLEDFLECCEGKVRVKLEIKNCDGYLVPVLKATSRSRSQVHVYEKPLYIPVNPGEMTPDWIDRVKDRYERAREKLTAEAESRGLKVEGGEYVRGCENS